MVMVLDTRKALQEFITPLHPLFHILSSSYAEMVILSPSLRPRQERGPHSRSLARVGTRPQGDAGTQPYVPSIWPARHNWKAGHQGAALGFAPNLLYDIGSSQALHLPTWKVEKESLGTDEFKQQFMATARAEEWSLPDALGMPAQGQRAQVSPLRPWPAALSLQPRSMAPVP